MKQTAVDLVFDQLDEQVFRIDHLERRINISISFEDMMTLKKEAKALERYQISMAHVEGAYKMHFKEYESGDKYYKDTYEEL